MGRFVPHVGSQWTRHHLLQRQFFALLCRIDLVINQVTVGRRVCSGLCNRFHGPICLSRANMRRLNYCGFVAA